MQVRILSNDDRGIVEAFLHPYRTSSMFLLGNMQEVGLDYTGKRLHGLYWGAFDKQGMLQGVLAQYWNGNLIVQAPEKEALVALVSNFKEVQSFALEGLLGPDTQVQRIISLLELPSEAFSIARSEGLYTLALDALQVPERAKNPSVYCIEIEEKHFTLVNDWMRAYEIEALGAEDSDTLEKDAENRTRQMLNSDSHRILCIDDVAVSLCGRNASLDTVIQIGPVWTPPEHRRCGYARLIVAMFLEELRDQGITEAVLFTDNPHAILAYEAIGFRCVGDFNLSLLKEEHKVSKV